MNLEEVESDGRSLVQLDAGSANFNTTLNLTGYMSFLWLSILIKSFVLSTKSSDMNVGESKEFEAYSPQMYLLALNPLSVDIIYVA